MATRKTGHKARRGQAPPVAMPLPPTRAFPDAPAALALGLLVAVCYAPTTMGGFVWDDDVLTGAKPVRSLSGLWQIWFVPGTLGNEVHYWPVMYTMFWFEHKLWGFAPAGYHIVNLLLHMGAALLLWRLLLRLEIAGAWVAAAVFAVHPVHVESVAVVLGRKDLLATMFYLACVLHYSRFLEDGRRGRYLGAIGLFVLALLSKSIAMTLPVSLVIWHWWRQGHVTRADVARILPFALVGLIITAADWRLSSTIGEAVSLDYSLIERVMIAAHSLWFYAGKIVWPTGLAVIYPHWEVGVGNPLAWGYVMATVAVVALLWIFRDRIGRGALAGTLFFAVTLSPTLGFLDYSYMEFSFVADRYQYLAGIGVIVVLVGAAVWGVGRLSGMWKTGVQVIGGLALVILGALTWHQSGFYRNDGTLFEHALDLNPQARSAHYRLGNWYMATGRTEDALASYRVSWERHRDSARIPSAIGIAYAALDQYQQAEQYFRHALRIDPHYTEALYNLAVLMTRDNRYEESLGLFQDVIKRNPGYVGAYLGMGVVLSTLNRHEEALRQFDRALSLDPSSEVARAHRHRTVQALKNSGN